MWDCVGDMVLGDLEETVRAKKSGWEKCESRECVAVHERGSLGS